MIGIRFKWFALLTFNRDKQQQFYKTKARMYDGNEKRKKFRYFYFASLCMEYKGIHFGKSEIVELEDFLQVT